MHTRISPTVVIVLVTTVVLVLITGASFSTNQVLAWNHEKKNSNSQNNFEDTSSTGATSNLKGLFACISHVANGINSLTQDEVLNCYMQTLPSNNGSNNTGPSLTSGNNNQIETSDSG